MEKGSLDWPNRRRGVEIHLKGGVAILVTIKKEKARMTVNNSDIV